MSTPLRCDIVLEQTLGHVTHSQNLQRILPTIDGFEPTFLPVEFSVEGPAAKVPGFGNWTIRAGVRGRRLVRSTWRRRGRRPDAMLVHTQVPAVLMGRAIAEVPTVISLDATPKQYDELGEFYAHDQGPDWIERVKFLANRRCLERAVHIITWSEWAKRGLTEEYGIDPSRITTIAPGVDIGLWQRPVTASTDGLVEILFVGGDLQRKGGDLLAEACRRLRNETTVPPFELHVVTHAEVEPEPGLVVHHGLTANSPELIERFHRADIFCLPTLGDCLPMVLAEAAAAGLPLVSTDVGAIREIVRPGETGELVRPGDVDGLAASLQRLIQDGDLRRRFGQAAAELAARDHDARNNARTIVETLRTAVGVQ